MKRYLLVLAWIVLPITLYSQEKEASEIAWPEAYTPSESKFYVQNTIEIQADPAVVWQYLLDASAWESWYEGAKNLSFSSSKDTILQANTVFTWETMGLTLQSTVKEFEPNRLLAWESKKKSIQAYHVWVLIPTEYGCKVITEESQNGWLTFFEKTFQGKKLKRLHDAWLLALKNKSENHPKLP